MISSNDRSRNIRISIFAFHCQKYHISNRRQDHDLCCTMYIVQYNMLSMYNFDIAITTTTTNFLHENIEHSLLICRTDIRGTDGISF